MTTHELLENILAQINDLLRRVIRLETRVFRIAEELHIDLKER